MATIPERVFAWVGVGVIIISVSALTGAVLIQQYMSNRAASTANADTAANSSLNCTDSSATEPTLAAPPAFTVSSAVSQVQQTDLSVGSGVGAKAGDCLVVKYYGTLASNGTMFDENYTKPTAFAFTLGAGQVIQGWDAGLIGLKPGGERRLVIPAAQAYGSQGSGSIPANADLVFYVKLLRIQK